MRRVGLLGMVASALLVGASVPPIARVPLRKQGVEEVTLPARRRVAYSPMAHRRYRSRNAPHRRILRANRLTVSRRTRRRHRRQRRAA